MSQDHTARASAGAVRGDDAGFSVVEVIVAMVIFVVMTLAVLGILLSALGGSRTNAQRVQAANIAAQQMEAVRFTAEGRRVIDGRASTIADITGGVSNQALTSTQTFDGTTYTVTQSAAYYSGDGTVSICRGNGESPTYQRVSVEVSWADQGRIPPVRSDTVVAVGLGKDGFNAARGILAIQVQGSEAQPVSGQLVTITGGPSVTTDTDGCAVFANLLPGTYQGTVNTPRFVGLEGEQLATSGPVGVVAGKVRKGTIDYDRAGQLNVVLTPPAGTFRLPVSDPPLRLGFGSYLDPSKTKVIDECTTATSTISCSTSGTVSGRPIAQRLFPGPYTAIAGACADARGAAVPDATTPPTPNGTPLAVPAGAVVPAGNQSVPAEVKLAGVTLNTPAVVGSSPLWAFHLADSGCAETVIALGSRSGSTTSVALPGGTWSFSYGASPATAGAPSTPTANLVPGKVRRDLITPRATP